MKKERLQKLAGLQLNEDISTMTREALKDIEKTVTHAYSRLLDDNFGDGEARKIINKKLRDLM